MSSFWAPCVTFTHLNRGFTIHNENTVTVKMKKQNTSILSVRSLEVYVSNVKKKRAKSVKLAVGYFCFLGTKFSTFI